MELSGARTQRSSTYFPLNKLNREVKEGSRLRALECLSRLNPCRTRTSTLPVESSSVSVPMYHGRLKMPLESSADGNMPSSSSEHLCSICKKKDKTSLCSFQSPYRFKAHDQCRTRYGMAPRQGPDHKVPSVNKRTSSLNQCCYSKWIQTYRITYSTVVGFLNGLILSLRKYSNRGISRIICLTILFAYLCLPLSHAAPRHKLRRLQTNYSRATEMDELLSLLRSLDEQTSVREDSSRRGSPNYRRPTRSGRSGRRRGTETPQLQPAVVASIIREEFRNASCRPRDTILDAFKETKIDRGYNRLVPECVMVKRCQNGGCCMEHQECTSAGSEYKTFYFWHNQQMLTKAIRQDTSCVCQDKSPYCSLTQDNCTKGMVLDSNQCKCVCPHKCPEPFLQIDNCECDCLMSDKRCKNFFRGKRGLSLTNSQCNCVQQGECLIPPCANGRFSMHHCRCINSSS